MTNLISLQERKYSKVNKILHAGKDSLFETLKARIIKSYLVDYGGDEQMLRVHLRLLHQEYEPLKLAGLKPEDPKVVEFLTTLQGSFENTIAMSHF